MKKYDLVIIGGGTSGCACAYIASKLGLKTLLVEKNNFLGGLMTGGLVVPVMKSSVDDLNNEYYKELVKVAAEYNAQITYKDKNDGWFNPEVLKIALDSLLTQTGIKENLDILFESEVKSINKNKDLITSIEIESKLLSVPIEAKHFVDATGSASFSKLANCEFLADNEQKQQNTLRFILGNVNINRFCDFLGDLNDNEDITNTNRNETNDTINKGVHFTTASTWDTKTEWKLDKYLKQAVSDGILAPHDRSYFQIFSVAGGSGVAGGNGLVAFNCPRINNFQDVFANSNEIIEARRAIFRLFNFTKRYFPGFENAIITNIAAQTGYREENRVKTRYIYTKDDILSQKTFKTAVLRANYAIDIHSDKKNKSVLKQLTMYELPLESLMSANYCNLFVIGKIIGADFTSHSALRVQKSCMSMGEGVARYLSKI